MITSPRLQCCRGSLKDLLAECAGYVHGRPRVQAECSCHVTHSAASTHQLTSPPRRMQSLCRQPSTMPLTTCAACSHVRYIHPEEELQVHDCFMLTLPPISIASNNAWQIERQAQAFT